MLLSDQREQRQAQFGSKGVQGTHCIQVDSKERQEKITEPNWLGPEPHSSTFAGYREGKETGVTSIARNFPQKQKKGMHIR